MNPRVLHRVAMVVRSDGCPLHAVKIGSLFKSAHNILVLFYRKVSAWLILYIHIDRSLVDPPEASRPQPGTDSRRRGLQGFLRSVGRQAFIP